MRTHVLVSLLAAHVLVGCNLLTHEEHFPNGKLKRKGELTLGGDQTGEWTYYYQNGQLRAKGRYENDVQAGLWVYYYKNGELEMEGLFEEEKRSKVWRYWHSNGERRARGRFDAGRESGVWSFWDEQQKPYQLGDFERGRLAGRWTYWHSGGGGKKSEGYYLNGVKVGEWKLWDSSGRETTKTYPVPDGYQLVREEWEPGVIRREGFQYTGQATGRWVTYHRNGNRRLAGDFKDGQPMGQWMAWAEDGKPLAVGTLLNGRLTGDWTAWENGIPQPMYVEGIAPPGLATADWSKASIVVERDSEDVVRTWLAEASSPAETIVEFRAPTDEPEQGEKPYVAVRAQPSFTVGEEKKIKEYEEIYTEGFKEKYSAKAYPGYYEQGYQRPRVNRGGASSKYGGDKTRSDPLVGQPLPLTKFQTADGVDIDLADYRGKKKVVLVVLRGFSGQVCVYCATQTKAYAQSKAFQTLGELNTEVLVVYPGPEGGIDAFREAYASLFGQTGVQPPYKMLYDPDLTFVKALGIESTLAIPTTLILDESGVIRYAYVGKGIQDRPSANELIAEIKKLSSVATSQ